MTASASEPIDVGPAVGGDLEATDLDRQHVVQLLNEATNEGLLPAAERDRRVSLARVAETFDDLVPLTRDLVSVDGALVHPVPLTAPAFPMATPASPASQIDTANATENADQIIAVFAGTTRKGHWRVRKNTSILAVFGGAELDTTEAVFEAREITINTFCMFGGVEVTVPPGVEVRNHAGGLFGGVETKIEPPQPGAPVITLKGIALFGGIAVKNPKRKKPSRG
ncbi:MAG: DUF1707 domain-containing protein [Propionicimonas sp.]|uniref:DUF1707 SHOCT-like domain-containing protein n=1 Tax=Propionicimonas sp. TaxID=1955623 RepID=UPI002B1FE6A0|nr:DUF1707 domain-containing protein [Propionicimonas sp.]MEA4945308.1 DUF1707 domain-containing protein [Propionicimonas sp.]